ncbi:MAG: DUF4476 domain-containing protein [Bacteroidia bacterium]
MKKAALISCFVFCSAFHLFSQAYDNNLVFFSKSYKAFTLYLNDEKINANPEINVKAFHVSDGWQKVRIEFSGEKDHRVLSDSIRIRPIERNNRSEIAYMIRDDSGEVPGLVFMSQGLASGPKAPPVPEAPKETIPMLDNNVYGNLYQAIDGKPVFFKNYDALRQACHADLNDKEVGYMLQLINKTNDFENQYKYIEQVVERNCYTAAQIAKILNLLTIEIDKLKLAEKAYPHLKDKAKVNELTGIFKYPTIKEEFAAFLNQFSVEQKQRDMNCTVALSDAEYKPIYEAVKKTPNEYEKTKQAKKELTAHCFSTTQLLEILNLFMHDRERLEFAKAAKLVVTDKENYPKLEEGFLFSETKTEFQKFISKQHE